MRAARSPLGRWRLQQEVATAAVAATGASTARRRESTVTKVEHGNSSKQPARRRPSDANIVPQAPQPPELGASDPALFARDAQFFGNCHKTWWEVSSQYRDRFFALFTKGQLPLRWLGINTVRSQRRRCSV